MAETLRQFQNHFAIIFEGNQSSSFGVIREITDEKVLQYEQVVKILYTPSGNFTHSVDLMFISICDITEFIPFGPAPAVGGAIPEDLVSVINNLKQ
ncbi:hypothetical protein QFZ28_002536 [Neobacillus niacini]|uniref:hypothetical protein n=1 Tax=Neobacillus niacini TaxID=86668 RepID=UPI0027857809|nr:hypothetical protein [Neobacillus niacini]MDQ1002136.1 hypothetical protein [Neobacillus niacini]